MADTQVYGTMCTDIGNAAIANSVLTGTKVNFAQIVVGDGNGTPYVPASGQTSLKHQVWSGAIAEVTQDPDQMNRMILHAVLPSSVGGWVMREIGVLDDKGQLLAVGNTPEIPKEVVTSGAIMEMDLYIYISVVDARGVNVIIDPTVIIATKADINKLWDTVNKLAQSVKLGDNVYAATNAVITLPAADSTHDGYMAKEQAEKLAGIEDNANNYTHPNTAGNKHIPAGGAAGQALMWQADGTAKWQQVHYTFTATLPASGWSSTAPYTQIVSVAGMTADMDPHLYLVPATSGAPTETEEEAFACITGGTTAAGTVTFHCREDKPAANITVRLEVHI